MPNQIEMPASRMEMEEGTSMPLVVTVKTVPEGYERLFDEITYQSTDDAIATISSDGIVTALKEGTTMITATILEEQASMEVVVKPVCECVWIWITLGLILILLLILIGSWRWYFGQRRNFEE